MLFLRAKLLFFLALAILAGKPQNLSGIFQKLSGIFQKLNEIFQKPSEKAKSFFYLHYLHFLHLSCGGYL